MVALFATAVSLTALVAPPAASISPYATCGYPTGSSATVLIGADVSLSHPDGTVEAGDQLAALAPDGSCAGVVTWDGDGAALTVWVDDPFTEDREGLIPGEPVSLAIWDASSGEAYESDVLGAKIKAPFGDPDVFMPDELYILEGLTSTAQATPSTESTFALAQNFPNPAQHRTTLEFSLDADGPVIIEVFDTLGRLVATPLDQELQTGDHHVALDVSSLASGAYIYRLRAGPQSVQRRMTVSR
ncbi:MAG: hypothetical protein Rubg2KO_27410 [Rubricoccaceae bacterium]